MESGLNTQSPLDDLSYLLFKRLFYSLLLFLMYIKCIIIKNFPTPRIILYLIYLFYVLDLRTFRTTP